MAGIRSAALRTSIPSTAITTAGNSGTLVPPEGATSMVVLPQVTAYTSGTATYEVQWSFDGTNWYSADSSVGGAAVAKDTFAGISAVNPGVLKYVTVKAPYYRIAWTGSPSLTHNFSDAPFSASAGVVSPSGFEQGAPSLAAPVVGLIGSTTLSATFSAATASTYSAITAVPTIPGAAPAGSVPVARMAILLHVTANAGTSEVLEVLWSQNGLVYNASTNPTPLYHADPTDTFAPASAAFTTIKELPVKAPYFAIAITGGTPGATTFTADVVATAL
jgi:hypothetical protein